MMTEPTEPTMSASTYGSMQVNSVTVHAPVTELKHAATKGYVDAVRDGILGDGVSGALYTLKEIGDYLNDGSVASSVVSQLTSVQSQLNAEISRASGAEGALQSDLENEKGLRRAADTDINGRLAFETDDRITQQVALNDRANYLENRVNGEYTRALAAETALDVKFSYVENRANTLSEQHVVTNARIDTESAARLAADQTLAQNLAQSAVEASAYVDAGLAMKLDKSGGMVSGDLNVTGQVYIGPHWKIQAQGTSLVFLYSPDGGENFSVGIPFISV